MKRTSIFVLIGAVLVFGAALLFRQGTPDKANAKPVAAQQQQQQQQQPDPAEVAAARKKVTDDPVAPKVAPKGYDVTVVTYTDYQCPFCRKMHPALDKLIANDKKVRVVYHDWPIFGAPSVEAAKLAIASQWQGKHKAFDDALMQIQGKLSSEKIRAAADKAGVNWNRLQADLKKHSSEIDGLLARTGQQAAMMGLSGTPAVLIGPYLVPGALDYDQLVKAVALARKYPNGNAPADS
ncbi:DsbA family protein [Stakelama marina]|uniref:DsbA family protein n=1 Tax=Stakelama marina TaxID=2826939 RepID=A0A8T4IHH0_9SPHN|nr:DsbA family protein [Stakelama marina]MBR0551666.1 DsbA family protein [Stakelama marina]